ncbi:Anti-sigma regulatory factor (Ser/Thr protein kinase) [Micromonospora coriariae]|uniref:Anti-sigma regulatory factor (Ser/Thr protein kinase) n=1 Tax=Micromonospora coriariae TaxID=285665 RepID=A0A1C4XFE5_9ACTN|nr:sensor histidine kinase [Micromonospora coriariae]SCF07233.1 Anti-sigma regulatory factor (Ser/Thr protein kinase) [Micromonospora coriariae]
MSISVATRTDSFAHPALFYADHDEYLAGTLPFIQAGLAADEPVMVAVPGDNLHHIRAALGTDAGRVQLHDMSVAGRNPARIIPGVLLAFAAAHAGKRVRIIGEPIWAGRTATEYPACAQHEALINAAFAGRPATILCPYDTRHLDRRWLDDAHRTHPVVQLGSVVRESPHYADPVAVAAGFNLPLQDPPARATTITIDLHALSVIRRVVTAEAIAAGLPSDRVADLTLAVSELAANTIKHTAGGGTLAVWTDDTRLICQLTDTGHITNPLAGRIPVPPQQPGSRGLLLVNQLCDLVRVHTVPGATTIRLHMHR